MKKRILIGALAASSLFLGTLTACDDASSMPINTTSVKETTSNSINDELLKKVYNEIKNSYTDTTYENFIANVYTDTQEDRITFDYLGMCISVDFNGSFIEKRLDIEDENNQMSMTIFKYINNEWLKTQYSKIIDGEEYIYYQVAYDETFSMYFKYEFTYNDNGKEASMLQSILKNNEWVYDVKMEYTYDEKGKLSIQEAFAYNGNEWILYNKSVAFGNQLQPVYAVILKADRSYFSKTERTYSDDGKVLTMTFSRFMNNEWVKIDETITHGNRDLTTYSLTLNEDGSFKSKDEYAYDENGNLKNSAKSMYINNEWVKIKEEIYNDDGSRIVTSYEVNEDGIYTKREEKTYSNAMLIMEISSIYENDEWAYDYKREYEYDDNGHKTGYLSYFYSNGEWVLAE